MGASFARNTTRLRQSSGRLLRSFSTCAGICLPSCQTVKSVNSSFQFWSASMNSHSISRSSSYGKGL